MPSSWSSTFSDASDLGYRSCPVTGGNRGVERGRIRSIDGPDRERRTDLDRWRDGHGDREAWCTATGKRPERRRRWWVGEPLHVDNRAKTLQEFERRGIVLIVRSGMSALPPRPDIGGGMSAFELIMSA